MKSIISTVCTVLLVMILASEAGAQKPASPEIPGNTFVVTDFGAKGDGATINTNAIQQALDKAATAGGKVIIPKGNFLTGPLVIRSHTNLELQKGAFLKLRNEIDSIPVEKERYRNLISINKASDIKISGEGTIDGQGQIWWDKFTAKELIYRRPQLLFAERVERLELEGITFLNPPNTHVSLKNCKDVYIHHISIEAPEKSRNTDGLNISVKNCLIEDCSIRTGDDNIAINFGNRNNTTDEPECENITIRNCTFGYGHGLSIGSYTAGGLRNLTVRNCTFEGTTSGIRIKTARGRGGLVENLTYADLKMNHVKWPVFISAYYPKEPISPEADSAQPIDRTTPVYRNISLENITIQNAGDALKIWGIPESPITGIRFVNVKIDAKKGMQIYHAKEVRFERSSIRVAEGERLKTYNATVTGLE